MKNIPLIYRNVIKGRYLINKKGEVFCLWRLNNNNGKTYHNPPKKISIDLCQAGTSARIHLAVGVNKQKAFFLHTIMSKVFNIKKPDNFNQYRLYYKDGNPLNNSLNNIAYKKFTQYKINGSKYESVNVVRNGSLVGKICVCCGKLKSAEHYMLSSITNGKKTLKNKCVQCSSVERWNKIKSDNILMERANYQKKKFRESKKGRKWFLEYNRNDRENLGDTYIRKVIQLSFKRKLKHHISLKEIPKDMVDIYRTRILTHRNLKHAI